MYISINATDPKLSYKLVKHPETKVVKQLREYRSVEGEWRGSTFFCYTVNDDLLFLETYREKNWSSYVSVLPTCVSPFNLVLFSEMFGSALNGNKIDQNITDEQFNEKIAISIEVGPFVTCDLNLLEDLCAAAEISALVKPIQDYERVASIVFIGFKSVTEMLQIAYAISFFVSFNFDIFNSFAATEKQDKVFRYCAAWFDKISNKKSLLRRLASYSQKLADKFVKKFQELNENFSLDEPLFKETLHEQRHKIVSAIVDNLSTNSENLFCLELGCGSGQLAKHLPKKIRYAGVDKNAMKIEKGKKFDDLILGDFNFPLIDKKYLDPNVLILSEVIEHLTSDELDTLWERIKTFYRPEYIVITTPNRAYNHNYGLTEGQLRHKDHKREFTLDELRAVIDNSFDIVSWYFLNEEEPLENQPSFIVLLKRNTEYKFNHKFLRQIQEFFAPIYLPTSNKVVDSRALVSGKMARQFELGVEQFYLASTIAPVEYDARYDYDNSLETPESAVQYFKDRGLEIEDLIFEEKEMGSRGYILFIRDEEKAKKLGLPKIVVNSRQGFRFFDPEKTYNFNNTLYSGGEALELLHNELCRRMYEHDFAILDCEILPWSLKSKELSEKQFLDAGYSECNHYNTIAGDTNVVGKIVEFINTVETYLTETPVKIVVFDMVAFGDIQTQSRKDIEVTTFANVTIGKYLQKYNVNFLLDEYFALSTIFQPVSWYTLDSISDVKNLWEHIRDIGKEGLVVKPNDRTKMLPSGYPIQPALKVRTPEYLQIVYGIRYQSPEYFDRIIQRNVARKRATAILETEISENMLRAFLNRKENMVEKFAAAFFATDSSASRALDATL